MSAAAAVKRYRGGTHRVWSPEETVARVRHLFPILGITRVADVTGLDTVGIPVVMVCRPNARSLSVSQGKGVDLGCARASGVMEAVELYHGEHVTLPLKLATHNELRYTHEVLDLAGLARASVSRFHHNARLLWIEGRDLHDGRAVWLPFEVVHTDYTLPLPTGSGAFLMSSSGLASGNHPLEAVSHALCELVEHDATTLWHCLDAPARRATRLDLDSVDDPACRELIDRYRRAGVTALVFETTSDLGVASFLCTVVDAAADPSRPVPAAGGLGCHPAREIALARALTEAAQSRLTLIAGSRDDIRRGSYRGARDGEIRDDLAGGGPAPRRFAEVPTRAHDTLDEDVAFLLERLRACGFSQAVAVDLARPEFGVPVVRVVVPGLESLHDAPHWLPGARARRRLAERAP